MYVCKWASVTKTINNCIKFNEAGYLHSDIKPANTIISLDKSRQKLGGLLIDFGMTRTFSARVPPLDALYFLLMLFKEWPWPIQNDEMLKYLAKKCKTLYTKILEEITYAQIIGCFNGSCPEPSNGSEGYAAYDIKEQLDKLLRIYNDYRRRDRRDRNPREDHRYNYTRK